MATALARVLTLLAVSSLTVGCTTLIHPSVQPEGPISVEKHLIYIDAQGDLVDPVSREKVFEARTLTAAVDDELETCADEEKATPLQRERWRQRRSEQEKELAYVNDLIEHYLTWRSRKPHLQATLHVHGGLNTLGGVIDRANLLPGYMLRDDHYPIMLGWPSGFLRSYKDHLVRSDRGRQRNNVLTTFYGTMAFVEDIARSIVRTPSALVRQIDNTLTVPLGRESSEEKDAEVRGKERLRSAGFKVVSEGPYRGVGGTYFPSALNPIGWLATPLRDGLGSGAWEAMLRQTDLVLTKASVFEGTVLPVNPCGPELPNLTAGPGDTAATMFLLQWQKDPRTKDLSLDVVGHSMGAIVTLQLLSRHPGVNFRNVVFMGAAARIKDVESILVPWLANHREARFYNLSLDPYNEIAERSYYDFVPRGSLLMWIDDTFGAVNSFRDRTVGKWWNVVRIAEDLFPRNYSVAIPGTEQGASGFIQRELVDIRSRVVLKRFPIKTDGSLGPQTHGDFNMYCFWRKDFWETDIPAKPLFAEALAARSGQTLDDSCAHETAVRNRQ